MKVFETKNIRNIALIGGAKSGKTTMAESMLFEGKMINRRGAIEDQNTMSDYRQIELEREHSVHSTFYIPFTTIIKSISLMPPGFQIILEKPFRP